MSGEDWSSSFQHICSQDVITPTDTHTHGPNYIISRPCREAAGNEDESDYFGKNERKKERTEIGGTVSFSGKG